MPATLYRDAALADGRTPELRVGVSILVRDGRIAWIRPGDAEEDPGPGAEVVDASGGTAVPGMVDCHSHVTMPGGAHWIERGLDPPEVLLRCAEENGRLLTNAGVRWARDVGAPLGVDPVASVVERTYLIHRNRQPIIRIAETFPISVYRS